MQKYRRDQHVPAKYPMPNPKRIGEAIDCAIHNLRTCMCSENYYCIEDVSTGERYSSLRMAVVQTGICPSAIRRSLMTGNHVRGRENAFRHVVHEKKKEDSGTSGHLKNCVSMADCYLCALKVDFLTTKREVEMYARALFEAAKWGCPVTESEIYIND